MVECSRAMVEWIVESSRAKRAVVECIVVPWDGVVEPSRAK